CPHARVFSLFKGQTCVSDSEIGISNFAPKCRDTPRVCVTNRGPIHCNNQVTPPTRNLRRKAESQSNNGVTFPMLRLGADRSDSIGMSAIRSTAIAVVLLCAVAIPARATTITVTNTNDSGPGSLRQALADANDGDTIDATSISGTITLTTGELLVDKSVTINGAGANVLAVDGNMASRVFRIPMSGETITISGLTIRNGHAGTTGGGIDNENDAILTITNCTVVGNTAGLGGGIFNGGTLTIADSTGSGNSASTGGGTYNDGAGTETITNSTFSGNTAAPSGGGIFNINILVLTNSTLSGNSAGFGGGIYNLGTVQIGDTILNVSAISSSGTVT